MKFVADFHIHSHYSRATSRELTFEHLHKWAQLKGIQVLGTGDLTHPGWLAEMQAKLEPAEDGLFRLKDEHARAMQTEVFAACQQPVRFILSGEISTIYKKNDQVRKVHHVIFLPSLTAVENFQTRLEKVGNIRSDGRPILGLDSHDLLELVLETDPQAYLIPAHIWTPWFSLFGSKSGFDRIEDCFEELTPHIFALETGLSSDPPMNWRLSALDRYTLVSNSDAHSPQKLAREANLFDTELSYSAIFQALQQKDSEKFLGTIEFFPEEGKYHYDGHRKCEICWEPQITLQHNGVCPVCGKKVTVGVMHRVEVLADRPAGTKPAQAQPFHSLIPLPEVLAEVYGVNDNSKRVVQSYETLLAKLGPELSILQALPLEDIERVGGKLLAEGLRRMRSGNVIAEAGYDGEFGAIRLFQKQERDTFTNQMGLIAFPQPNATPKQKQLVSPNLAGFGKSVRSEPYSTPENPAHVCREDASASLSFQTGALAPGNNANKDAGDPMFSGLNPQQREAVLCTDTSLIIVAGPGTGKTRTLTHRMAYLLTEKGVTPEQLLAITFTNKAADEMAQRLTRLVGEATAQRITIKTFHAFCAMILREVAPGSVPAAGSVPVNFAICTEHDRVTVLKSLYPDLKEKEINAYLEAISAAKNQLLTPEDSQLPLPGEDFKAIYRNYDAVLRQQQLVDFDDLILLTVQLFEAQPDVLQRYQQRFRWIAVDEYQDLNFAQYRLLKLLKTPDVNLCVIGDPDQAIYGFRGAKREYFLKFQEDFPDAKRLQLTQNYRSTQMILNASRQVIARSPDRVSQEIWSEFVSQTKLEIYHAPTYKAEAEYVVHQVEKMVGGTTHFSLDSGRVASHDEATRSFGDVAVLYRLGAQSQALTEAFERSGMPYQLVGQMALYDYKDVQQILAYLWLLEQPETELFWKTIGKRRADVAPLLDALRQAETNQTVAELIEHINSQVNIFAPDAERLKRLLRRAAPFEQRRRDFLEATALHKEADEYDPRADRVTLMTLHASKGLEFPVVFIVGCEETLLPYQRDGEICDLEEERRLFYVGMTRAQHKLILTHATKRFLFGQTVSNAPSRFLDDIEQALKELIEMERRKAAKIKADSPQLALF